MNPAIRIPAISMDRNIQYLLGFLEDEFRDLPDVRIHPVAPTGTRKSQDLPQDYDPNENRVHLNRGVRIRVSSRDYFFPVEWIIEHQMARVHDLAREVREYHQEKNP